MPATLKKPQRWEKRKWQDWMTQAMKTFTSAEIKYFGLEDEQTAKAWIKLRVVLSLAQEYPAGTFVLLLFSNEPCLKV